MEMMKLTFVNVGYGEAILGECPAEGDHPFRFLIDGGSANASEYADRSGGRVPMEEYLRDRGVERLDLLISTHTHEDHICGGLRAAQLLPPREFWQTLPPGFDGETRALDVKVGTNLSQTNFISALNDYKTLCQLVRSKGGAVRQLLAGQRETPCPGLEISVLAPNTRQVEELEERTRRIYSASDEASLLKALNELDSRMNNFSLMLLLDWHGTRILLPGDTNRLGYGAVDKTAIRADLFKVGHHGQIDGADEALLEAVQPRAVVCCASSDRRYNSAHPELLKLIASRGAQLYFSDCPPAPGLEAPPHRELCFTVGENGAFQAQYHR